MSPASHEYQAAKRPFYLTRRRNNQKQIVSDTTECCKGKSGGGRSGETPPGPDVCFIPAPATSTEGRSRPRRTFAEKLKGPVTKRRRIDQKPGRTVIGLLQNPIRVGRPSRSHSSKSNSRSAGQRAPTISEPATQPHAFCGRRAVPRASTFHLDFARLLSLSQGTLHAEILFRSDPSVGIGGAELAARRPIPGRCAGGGGSNSLGVFGVVGASLVIRHRRASFPAVRNRTS